MKAAVWSVVVAMAMILGGRATAAGQPAPADLSATPALAEAEQKIRTELALTPEQEARARTLITERLGKAEQIVDSFGDVSLDSVIDLLSEARAIKKEFIPQITSLLTPEQKARLAKLPKSEDLWTNVTSAWMAEARVSGSRPRRCPRSAPRCSASSTTPPTSSTGCSVARTASRPASRRSWTRCSTFAPRSAPASARSIVC